MTSMQTAISQAYQAGIEVGRDSAKREMAELDRLNAAFAAFATIDPSDNAAPSESTWRRARIAKASTKPAAAPKAPKDKIIAHGVKKAGASRTTGVKKAIMAFIADSDKGATTADVIAGLGFKPTSVNSTLADLKKKGLASQDGKIWFLTSSANVPASGNSETAHEAGIGSEY